MNLKYKRLDRSSPTAISDSDDSIVIYSYDLKDFPLSGQAANWLFDSIKLPYSIFVSPKGKPSMSSPHFHYEWSVSHSRSRGVLAVHPHLQLGVDVEFLRPVQSPLKIAKRLFCQDEFESLKILSEPELSRSFLNAWSKFEAQQKCTAQGVFGKKFPVHASRLSLDDSVIGWIAWSTEKYF